MSYVSYVLAFIELLLHYDTKSMTAMQGLDRVLDLAVGWQDLFFKLSLILFAIIVIVGVLFAFARGGNGFRMSSRSTIGCSYGCIFLVFLVLPVVQWILLQVSKNLADAVTPEAIVDPIRFWGLVILMVLVGVG